MVESIIRIQAVKTQTGLSRSSIYGLIKLGEFPKQIRLSNGRAVGWIASEVNAWLASRVAASRQSDIQDIT